MASPNPIIMPLVLVLVDTEVPAVEGMEDDVVWLIVEGAALLLRAAVIHVGTDGSER
jgi:hypothetical protein